MTDQNHNDGGWQQRRPDTTHSPTIQLFLDHQTRPNFNSGPSAEFDQTTEPGVNNRASQAQNAAEPVSVRCSCSRNLAAKATKLPFLPAHCHKNAISR